MTIRVHTPEHLTESARAALEVYARVEAEQRLLPGVEAYRAQLDTLEEPG